MGGVAVFLLMTAVFVLVGLIAAAIALSRGRIKLAYRAWFLSMAIPATLLLMALGLSESAALIVSLAALGGLLLFLQLGAIDWVVDGVSDRVLDRKAWKAKRALPQMKRSLRSQTLGVGALAFSIVPAWGLVSIPFALAGVLGGGLALRSAPAGTQRTCARTGVVTGAMALVVSAVYLAALVAIARD